MESFEVKTIEPGNGTRYRVTISAKPGAVQLTWLMHGDVSGPSFLFSSERGTMEVDGHYFADKMGVNIIDSMALLKTVEGHGVAWSAFVDGVDHGCRWLETQEVRSDLAATAKMMAAAPHLAEILESVLDTLEDAAQEGLNAYDPDTERQSKWVLGAIEDIIEALEAAGIEVKR